MASRRAARRQIFRNKAALGADRNNDGVLDVLRLHQAENFGAEILRPIGPANAAARHLAEAQMHRLKARRIEENLVQRPRQRHIVDFAAREFYRDKFFHASALVALIKIGADRGHDRVDEVAQDAVFIEAVDRLQSGFNRRGNLGLARRALVLRGGNFWIEPRVEQMPRCWPRCRRACAASPTCSPANRAPEFGAGTARWCG